MKIQTILFFTFLGIIFLTALFGYLSYASSQSEMKRLTGENLEFLAVSMMGQLDADVVNRVENLQTFAISNEIDKLLLTSNQEYAKLKDPTQFILEQDKDWIHTPPDENSSFMADITNNPVSSELRAHKTLLEEKYGYPLFGEFFITNMYGANVAQTERTSDFKQDDEEWWQKAKQYGVYVGDVKYDQSAGIFSVDLAVAINDENKNFMGVLIGVYNIESVTRIVDDLKTSFDDAGVSELGLKLLDENGRLIHSPEHEGLFDKVPEEEFSNIKGKSGYFISDGVESDELHAYSVSNLPLNGSNTGWIALVEQDLQTALAHVYVSEAYFIVIVTALTAVSFVLWWGVTRLISKPIRALQNSTKKIADGNYENPLPEKGTDEVIQLSKSFNSMLASLKSRDKRIQKQIEDLKGLDEQKDEFVSMVSHELKTPLTPILGNLEMLMEQGLLGKVNPDQLAALKDIQNSTKRLNLHANDLILMNRLASNNLLPKKERIQIGPFLDEIEKNFESSISTKNATFVNSTKSAFSIMSDRENLMEIFFQLIRNSLDHLPLESGKIEINAEDREHDVIFYVKDNGSGIPKEKQTSLFRKFSQVDTSITRSDQGLGLGLAICYGIVEILKGRIWVESEGEGKGTTVYFTISKD